MVYFMSNAIIYANFIKQIACETPLEIPIRTITDKRNVILQFYIPKKFVWSFANEIWVYLFIWLPKNVKKKRKMLPTSHWKSTSECKYLYDFVCPDVLVKAYSFDLNRLRDRRCKRQGNITRFFVVVWNANTSTVCKTKG